MLLLSTHSGNLYNMQCYKIPIYLSCSFPTLPSFPVIYPLFFKRLSSNCSSVLGYDKMQCKAKILHALFCLIKDAWTLCMSGGYSASCRTLWCNTMLALFQYVTSCHGLLFTLRDHFCSSVFLPVVSKLCSK